MQCNCVGLRHLFPKLLLINNLDGVPVELDFDCGRMNPIVSTQKTDMATTTNLMDEFLVFLILSFLIYFLYNYQIWL